MSKTEVKTGFVIDVGGGEGSVRGRVGEWSVQRYEILDLPQYDLNQEWDTELLKTELLYGHADLIFCLEVFEYLYNPVIAINNIAKLMKKGGQAIISFAFVYPHHNQLERDYLRYTEPMVHKLAELADLKVDKIIYRRDRGGFLKRFYQDDGMRAAKQYLDHSVTGFIVRMSK